jgi:prefoldin subunit 5
MLCTNSTEQYVTDHYSTAFFYLGFDPMRLLKLFPQAMLASTLAVAMPSMALQDKALEPVVKEAAKINESAATSQQKIDQMTDKIDSKLQQFRTINKETDGLRVYNEQMQKQLKNLDQEVADLQSAITDVSVIERQITPLMIRMIDGLKQFIALDVPFLAEERQKRLADLQNMMERADVAPSEKFRRVMEAYQIEMDYGRTLEAYSGLHTVDGQERDVDFLRVGRTAFIFQTRDGSSLGIWNKQSRQWDALPDSYRSEISKALRMAKKQLAPDLLSLPVAITDVSE